MREMDAGEGAKRVTGSIIEVAVTVDQERP